MSASDSIQLRALLQQVKRDSGSAASESPRVENLICLAAEVHERIYQGRFENFDEIAKELESMIATQNQTDRENRPPTRYVE